MFFPQAFFSKVLKIQIGLGRGVEVGAGLVLVILNKIPAFVVPSKFKILPLGDLCDFMNFIKVSLGIYLYKFLSFISKVNVHFLIFIY